MGNEDPGQGGGLAADGMFGAERMGCAGPTVRTSRAGRRLAGGAGSASSLLFFFLAPPLRDVERARCAFLCREAACCGGNVVGRRDGVRGGVCGGRGLCRLREGRAGGCGAATAVAVCGCRAVGCGGLGCWGPTGLPFYTPPVCMCRVTLSMCLSSHPLVAEPGCWATPRVPVMCVPTVTACCLGCSVPVVIL